MAKYNYAEMLQQQREQQLQANPFLPFEEEDASRNAAWRADPNILAGSWTNEKEWTAKTQAQNAFNNYQEMAPYQEAMRRQGEMLDLTKGQYNTALNDPIDQFIMERLKQQADPRGMQNALFTQGADQATAAGAARWGQQQDSLAMRGLTPKDGAYQAAQNQNMMQRQQDVQRARLQSNLAGNQQASQAIGQMQGQQSGQANRQQQAYQNYNQWMQSDVPKAPTQNRNTGAMPQVNSGAGSSYKPLDYSQFTQAWAKANAPTSTMSTRAWDRANAPKYNTVFFGGL